MVKASSSVNSCHLQVICGMNSADSLTAHDDAYARDALESITTKIKSSVALVQACLANGGASQDRARGDLDLFGHAGKEALHVHLARVPGLRFQEKEVPFLVGKADQLFLKGGAVARPGGLDRPRRDL